MKIRSLFALVAGILFGVGLILGGVVDPQKVKAFLDVYGRWDPSFAMLILGAVVVASPAFLVARWRSRSYGGHGIELPERRGLDWKLVLGALLFGIGWGLVGLGPGPALVAASTGYAAAIAFVPGMLVGIVLYDQISLGFADLL
jgi:uncharacterized membrane protein YedE/YeeE